LVLIENESEGNDGKTAKFGKFQQYPQIRAPLEFLIEAQDGLNRSI
jgi:hypothetical protein